MNNGLLSEKTAGCRDAASCRRISDRLRYADTLGEGVMLLQRTFGNQSVLRLLRSNILLSKRATGRIQRQPAGGEAEAPTAKAEQAANEAESLRQQQEPCIWFDSWSNDMRDNDRDGKIDEKDEQQSDGIHYPNSYKGSLCDNDPSLATTDALCQKKTVDVDYRVCIDIPRAAYKAAGISFPNTRSVVTAMEDLKRKYKGSWKVFMYNGVKDASFNGTLQKGDFVAERHGTAWLGHSGIVLSSSDIIHLPGPSRGLSSPSACNDIVKDSGFGHTFVARPIV